MKTILLSLALILLPCAGWAEVKCQIKKDCAISTKWGEFGKCEYPMECTEQPSPTDCVHKCIQEGSIWSDGKFSALPGDKEGLAKVQKCVDGCKEQPSPKPNQGFQCDNCTLTDVHTNQEQPEAKESYLTKSIPVHGCARQNVDGTWSNCAKHPDSEKWREKCDESLQKAEDAKHSGVEYAYFLQAESYCTRYNSSLLEEIKEKLK